MKGIKSMQKKYWKEVVNKLLKKDEASWAAHVLSTNVELLDDILEVINKEILIKNCLCCYAIDFSAQPYLDEILMEFPVSDLIRVYKALEEKPLEIAGALMWLLEDIDPEFKWVV